MQRVAHTLGQVAIVGVIGAEDLNVLALDEVSNLEDGITHPHPEIFTFSVIWNGRRTAVVHGFDHHTRQPLSHDFID